LRRALRRVARSVGSTGSTAGPAMASGSGAERSHRRRVAQCVWAGCVPERRGASARASAVGRVEAVISLMQPQAIRAAARPAGFPSRSAALLAPCRAVVRSGHRRVGSNLPRQLDRSGLIRFQCRRATLTRNIPVNLRRTFLGGCQ
jgi:hypothetical protein